MHKPADIGRELLRFRSGQEHAKFQGMKEAPVRNPAPMLDQIAMHDGDWPAGTLKLIKPSFGQYNEACHSEIGKGGLGRYPPTRLLKTAAKKF